MLRTVLVLNDPTTTSGVSLMWSSTPVGETAVLSCPTTDRNATRRLYRWEEYGKNLMLMTVLVLNDPTTTSGV